MYFLPPEVQLDILKHLNFTQLLSIQQTNIYFKNFINQCESLLARKEEDQIGFSSVNELYLNEYKLYKPDPKLYEFKLSEQLEEKWKCAIDKSIPMFLSCNDDDRMNIVDVSLFESNPSSDWGLLKFNLPNYPKNVEEMKIARYLFRQIFKCFFRNATLDSPRSCILNPKMIELLFEENKTNMDLNIHSQFAIYSLSESTDNEKIKYFLTFALNHLISNELRVKIPHPYTNIDKNTDILFEILTNGGNQFSKVSYWYPYDLPTSHKLPKIYNTIIEHIETSKDISKMVKEIELRDTPGRIILSARAENIEIKFKNIYYNWKFTKYQLSNKYNPKLKFLICNEEKYFGTDVEIKKIIL